MSTYIDLGKLLEVALVSLGFTAALALVYGLGVVGVSRSQTSGTRGAAFGGAVLAFALFAAAVVFGIVVMARK